MTGVPFVSTTLSPDLAVAVEAVAVAAAALVVEVVEVAVLVEALVEAPGEETRLHLSLSSLEVCPLRPLRPLLKLVRNPLLIFVYFLKMNKLILNLLLAFADYGGIEKVRIMKDRDTGSSKGFGYVDFFDVESAERAKKEVFFFSSFFFSSFFFFFFFFFFFVVQN